LPIIQKALKRLPGMTFSAGNGDRVPAGAHVGVAESLWCEIETARQGNCD